MIENKENATEGVQLFEEEMKHLRNVPPWELFSSMCNTNLGMDAAKRAYDVLKVFPPPGYGQYSHNYLMTSANALRNAGVSPAQACQLIRNSIPHGKKMIPDRDILEAVKKAYKTKYRPSFRREFGERPKPDFYGFIKDYSSDYNELSALSPHRMFCDSRDAVLILDILYHDDDYLFIGDTYGSEVKTLQEWRKDPYLCSSTCPNRPLIIPNPLNGESHYSKSGTLSKRCDACVADFRFAVVEFDGRPITEQVAFWLSAIDKDWPVAAVIYSGGKSLHGWLAVKCADCNCWETSIEQRLFPDILVPMGCDPACRNESRLSRLPGHYRYDTKKWQTLLYLNPEVVR